MDGAQLCSAGSGSASGKRRRSKGKPDKQVPPRLPPQTYYALYAAGQARTEGKRNMQGRAGQGMQVSSLGFNPAQPSPAPFPSLPLPHPSSLLDGRTDEWTNEKTDRETDGRTDGLLTPPSQLYFSLLTWTLLPTEYLIRQYPLSSPVSLSVTCHSLDRAFALFLCLLLPSVV